MFVWSVKGKTLKFIGIVCLAAALMIALFIFVPKNSEAEAAQTSQTEVGYNFDKVRSNSDRIKFLEQFGWKTDKKPVKECVVTIPKDFDALMTSYNALQKNLGLDLENYAGRDAVRYTYRITNYPDAEGDVFANVMIYKSAVIGGDVCSTEGEGFIHDLTFPGGKPMTEEETTTDTTPESTPETAPETTPETEN